MKRLFPLLAALALVATVPAPAQDAATQEALDKLEGYIKDVKEAQEVLQRRLTKLTSELSALQDKVSNANGAVASQDDLRRLAEKVQQIERNRESDKELILRKIEDLAKLERTPPPRTTPRPPPDPAPAPRNPEEKGYEYVIQPGDTLSTVIDAYRAQGIKVNLNDILKANPGLNPNKLRVNQKIFIPAPK